MPREHNKGTDTPIEKIETRKTADIGCTLSNAPRAQTIQSGNNVCNV